MKLIDLEGMRFGKLKVIDRGPNTVDCKARWYCRCICGEITLVDGRDLRRDKTKSCGKRKRHKIRALKPGAKHLMTNTKLYRVWADMKSRTTNTKHKDYSYYGGRGISICDDWVHNFDAFYEWSIVNGYVEGTGQTIDRICGKGPYHPLNCRWASRLEQTRNRSNTKYLLIEGERLTLKEWADISGLTTSCLRGRTQNSNKFSEFDRSILRPPTRGKNAKKDKGKPYIVPYNWKQH